MRLSPPIHVNPPLPPPPLLLSSCLVRPSPLPPHQRNNPRQAQKKQKYNSTPETLPYQRKRSQRAEIQRRMYRKKKRKKERYTKKAVVKLRQTPPSQTHCTHGHAVRGELTMRVIDRECFQTGSKVVNGHDSPVAPARRTKKREKGQEAENFCKECRWSADVVVKFRSFRSRS